jgi:ABC-type sugar transport system ATPase subunit
MRVPYYFWNLLFTPERRNMLMLRSTYVVCEGFRSIENINFPMKKNKNSQDLIYEIQNNERERLDLRTLVDRTAKTFR